MVRFWLKRSDIWWSGQTFTTYLLRFSELGQIVSLEIVAPPLWNTLSYHITSKPIYFYILLLGIMICLIIQLKCVRDLRLWLLGCDFWLPSQHSGDQRADWLASRLGDHHTVGHAIFMDFWPYLLKKWGYDNGWVLIWSRIGRTYIW